MDLPDVSQAVFSYMNLFMQNFQRTGENGKLLLRLLTFSTIKDFPEGGQDYVLLKERIDDIIQSIPVLNKGATLKATGRRGTYGTVYMDAAEPNVIYKVIDLPVEEASKYERMHAFLKEALIQHILSVDAEYGSHVPKVLGIFKNIGGSMNSLTIKMEKSNITLYARIQKKVPTVRLDYLRPILTEVFRLLMKLHEKYHFTHRDFKSDNIMYKAGVLQFIDFGMACIHFKAFGGEYNIINNVYYTTRSKCQIEQDIALFLLKLQIDFGEYFDQDMKRFMADIGMPQFLGILGQIKAARNAEAGLLGKKAVLFHMAYNRNNSLYKRQNVGPNFSPASVLAKLGLIVGTGMQRGPINIAQPPQVATQVRPPMMNMAQAQNRTTRKNNARVQPKGVLVGTRTNPTNYIIMPARRLVA